MRARVVAALVIVAGSVAATGWAVATRDVRRVHALLERVDAELEAAATHPPPRPVLRGSPGPFVALPTTRSKNEALDETAPLRSAIVCESPSVVGYVRTFGPTTALRGFWSSSTPTPLEQVQLGLEIWRLRDDVARGGTIGDLADFDAGQGSRSWRWSYFERAVDRLDRDGCDEVLAELAVL